MKSLLFVVLLACLITPAFAQDSTSSPFVPKLSFGWTGNMNGGGLDHIDVEELNGTATDAYPHDPNGPTIGLGWRYRNVVVATNITFFQGSEAGKMFNVRLGYSIAFGSLRTERSESRGGGYDESPWRLAAGLSYRHMRGETGPAGMGSRGLPENHSFRMAGVGGFAEFGFDFLYLHFGWGKMTGQAPVKMIERGVTTVSHYPFPDEQVPYERESLKDVQVETSFTSLSLVVQIGFSTIAGIF